MKSSFNYPERSNRLSLSNKVSFERLMTDADRLFSIGWLIRRLLEELRTMLTPQSVSESHLFFYSLRQHPERWFMKKMIESHQSSLGEIQVLYMMYPQKEQFLNQLKDQRKAAIEQFSQMQISKRWDSLKDDDTSWRSFADLLFKLCAADNLMLDFFPLIDSIALMTDVICGRESLYFLNATQEDRADLLDYLHAESAKRQPYLKSIDIRAELKSLLKEPWFDKFSADKNKYTPAWRELFIDELLVSSFGKAITDDWENTARNRQNIIKGNIIGCLKEANVFTSKATGLGIARAILYPNEMPAKIDRVTADEHQKKCKTLSSYIGKCRNEKYYYWILEYVGKFD